MGNLASDSIAQSSGGSRNCLLESRGRQAASPPPLPPEQLGRSGHLSVLRTQKGGVGRAAKQAPPASSSLGHSSLLQVTGRRVAEPSPAPPGLCSFLFCFLSPRMKLRAQWHQYLFLLADSRFFFFNWKRSNLGFHFGKFWVPFRMGGLFSPKYLFTYLAASDVSCGTCVFL